MTTTPARPRAEPSAIVRRLAPLLLLLGAAAGCHPGAVRIVLAEGEVSVPVTHLATTRPTAVPSGASADGRTVRVLVDLAVQVDLPALGRRLDALGLDRTTRRHAVVEALGQLAERSQTGLVRELERLRARGEISRYRTFSVVNRIWVEGSAEAIGRLARHPAVAAVVAETESTTPSWAMDRSRPLAAQGSGEPVASWAIHAIGADEAHRRGLDGRGVVVGIIDSGASAVHEQLLPGFAGPVRGWHDPRGERDLPGDGAFGHGTGVLSTAVGANRNGVVLGVAPGARWSACRALPDGHYDNALLTECADWMLNVAQPDILINAWFLPEPGCDLSVHRIVDAWRAAEILPVFAVGNEGPKPGMDRSPSNYVGLFPGGAQALSIGGVSRSDRPYPLSTPGPNDCDGDALYPLLMAPSEDLVAAFPVATSTYRQVDGTSFGTGLVAGAAAILLQASPESSIQEIEQALIDGAEDLGAPGPDAVYGHGLLNVPGALRALREPGPEDPGSSAGSGSDVPD